MAKLGLVILVLFSTQLLYDTVESKSNPTDFIRASCKATSYPTLCVKTLTGYAKVIGRSQRELAQTALRVSLWRARSASSFVAKLSRARGMKPRDYVAVRDCVENMGDTVDRLAQSARELGRARGRDFLWHVSNVQTWVSAALTDENTCLEGFSGRFVDGNVKAAIRRRIVNVAQVTSNALALVNRFAKSVANHHHGEP